MDAIDEPQTPSNDVRFTWLSLFVYLCAIVYIDASALFFKNCISIITGKAGRLHSSPSVGFIISVSSLHIHTLVRSRPADAPQKIPGSSWCNLLVPQQKFTGFSAKIHWFLSKNSLVPPDNSDAMNCT